MVESEFLFTGDGTALLVVGGTGEGTWSATGPSTFSYRVLEPLPDGAGTVEIAQDAVISGDAFVSEGLTVVRDAGGGTAREMTVRISARRVS